MLSRTHITPPRAGGHSVCSEDALRLMKEGAIQCPFDRATFQVTSLPKNFSLLDIIEDAHATASRRAAGVGAAIPPPPECSTCAEPHPARVHCVECNEDFCDKVADVHRSGKRTAGHTLQWLAGAPVVADAPQCERHKKPLEMFDTECDVIVCLLCVASTHHGHKCVDLVDGAALVRARLATAVAPLQENTLKVETALASVKVWYCCVYLVCFLVC
jgi:hypothetical protein